MSPKFEQDHDAGLGTSQLSSALKESGDVESARSTSSESARSTSSNWGVLWQLFRYGLNCLVVLGIKLCLVWLLLQWMFPTVAYFIVHIATFFISYAIHTRKTFKVAFSREQLKKYFYAVIGFKLFDYVAFNVLFTAFKLSSSWSVILASACEAVVKFLFVRRALLEPGNSATAFTWMASGNTGTVAKFANSKKATGDRA